jgi:hypothetical protein
MNTWIRFEPGEPPAPSVELATGSGGKRGVKPSEKLAVADFRGISNLVVFFAHGWSCAACRELLRRFSVEHLWLDAQVLAVVPILKESPPEKLAGVPALIDPGGVLHRKYATLIEFEFPGELMLFVLDSYNAPVRAWVGEEADELDLVQKAKEALDYIVIQCPE